MAFDVTDPRNATVLASCGYDTCGRVMTSSGQNAHSLAHMHDEASGAHYLVLTAQIDNNIGIVRIADPFLIALLSKGAT